MSTTDGSTSGASSQGAAPSEHWSQTAGKDADKSVGSAEPGSAAQKCPLKAWEPLAEVEETPDWNPTAKVEDLPDWKCLASIPEPGKVP